MAKNQGPWGNNDNANPWGDNEETLNSPKVVDFSVLERIKKDDGFDFKIRWALLALLVIWLLSGFYQIQPKSSEKYIATVILSLLHFDYIIIEVCRISHTVNT